MLRQSQCHFASSRETSARTVDQVFAVSKGLRETESLAHVQAFSAVASGSETSKGTDLCGSCSGCEE